MSGLFSTLNSSVMALTAHSRAIEITGKNLANVNNPAYARQRVVYGDRGTVQTPQGAQSLGLQALSIQQMRDTLLDAQLMREIGLNESARVQLTAYERAQAALGQTIDGTTALDATGTAAAGGLAAALDDFFNAFQDLASRPTDTGAKQALLQKAAILSDLFQQTDGRLAQVQTDLSAQVTSGTDEINRLLVNIADLNAQIGRFEINQPSSAVDLRDQRQAKLEELAKLMPVEVHDLGNGGLQVFGRDANGAEVLLVDNATVTGPVTFDGAALSGGNPAVVLAPVSGLLQGALAARDGAVQDLRGALDQFAAQMVAAVNSAYNPGATTGNDFFAASGVAAGSIRLENGLTTATLRTGAGGASGDNTLALAVAGLASRSFATANGDLIDGTLGNFYGSAVSRLGQAVATAESRARDQENIEGLIRSQRDAVSGVSLDEEMADLVRFQRAFQASSRVFSIVDELLDTVVNGLGR